MIDTIIDILKDQDYDGFKFSNVIRNSNSDSYRFTFNSEDKWFQLEITHQAIINMTNGQVINYIDNIMRNHPDLKKAFHHQEFYKKFDELLNE